MTNEDTGIFILDCLDAAFPDGRAQLLAAEPIPLGLNDLWRLRVDHAGTTLDLVLRRYRHWITWHSADDRDKAAREAAALAHVRAHGIPAPALYGYGPDWTLVSFVDGHRLLEQDRPPDEQSRAIGSLAGTLAVLHRLPLPDGPFPRVTTASTIATLHNRAATLADGRLARAVGRLRPLDEELPVFVHGDPNLSNVLFDDHFTVVGLIDWEDAAIADYRFDVATAYWFLLLRAPRLADAFIAAYEATSGAPVRDLPQWLALATVRAWAVAGMLRRLRPTMKLFSTEEEKAEAERRLAAAGW